MLRTALLRVSALAALLSAGVVLSQTTPPASPPVVPADKFLNIDELEVYLGQKHYQFVARQASRIEQNKKVFDTYDKAAVLNIQGEAYLQSGMSPSLAKRAFLAAAGENKDVQKSAVQTATALLIDRSPGNRYTPKTAEGKPIRGGPPAPISIADLTRRPDAIKALWHDDYAATETQIAAALKATALGPITAVAPQVEALRALELAATGADAKTAAVQRDLAERAAAIMTSALDTYDATVRRIDREANQQIQVNDTVTGSGGTSRAIPRHVKVGLSNQSAATLREILADAEKLNTVIPQLAGTLKVDAKTAFANSATLALKVAKSAKATLTADYGNRF